jgi:hypothetical protein
MPSCSLAKATWGTDDPAEIAKKIGPGWDQFFAAAAELKAKGYGIVSGDGDIWHAVDNSSEKGWIVDGKLTIDPKREAFLDQCDDKSLQYYWANGTLTADSTTKDTVASGTVMAMSNGELAFLGGQNMFEAFVPANKFANGKNLTQYDETINRIWRDQVRQYTAGNCTREEAIAAIKQPVADQLGIEAE